MLGHHGRFNYARDGWQRSTSIDKQKPRILFYSIFAGNISLYGVAYKRFLLFSNMFCTALIAWVTSNVAGFSLMVGSKLFDLLS
jgi:hypothetical protein